MVKRWGESGTARVGIAALGAAMVALPLIPDASGAYVLAVVYALGAGTLFPSLASLISRASDSGSQGSMLGGSQVVGGLGRVVGPLWAGFLFQSVGISSPFHLGAILVALAGVLSLRIPGKSSAPTPVAPAIEEVGSAD
jgi:MFS family permease